MKEEINKKLAEIFSTVFEKEIMPSDNISMQSEENWTSLKHIELIVMLEEEFEVSFDPEIIPELISKDAIAGELEKLLK